MERVIAWRIHQVASVLHLYPRRYSNLSTAFISPILPSWIRSRNCRPRLVYFLAIEMTRRRLASTISFLARLAALDGLDDAAEFGDRQLRLIGDLGDRGAYFGDFRRVLGKERGPAPPGQGGDLIEPSGRVSLPR